MNIKVKTNFIISGALRGGTVSLDYYLSQHPNIVMCPSDCRGFFSEDVNFEKGFPKMDEYESRIGVKSEDGVIGELCAEYLFRPVCISRIKIYNPEIKIISILRNPAERAFSHWQKNVNEGIEDMSFEAAIEYEKGHLDFLEEDQSARFRNYLSRGMYAQQVHTLLQYFDPHQLLFIKSEDLRDDTEVMMYRILQFLGLPFLNIDRTPKNLGDYTSSMPTEVYNNLIDVFAPDIYSVEQMLGWNCNDWIRPINSKKPMMDFIEA